MNSTLGDPKRPPLLLIIGANASGMAWPPALLERFALHHRVIRYDHRDTGLAPQRPIQRQRSQDRRRP